MIKYNIKMPINGVMYTGIDWIQLIKNSGQGRVLVNKVMLGNLLTS
jgi:hypothetical protein